MRFSTTTIEAFRRWRDYAFVDERELLDTITGRFQPTPRMLLGRAYGRVLEAPDRYRVADGYACGPYRFEADTIDPALATIDRAGFFEVKATQQYGAHTVVCKVDHILGTHVAEFKTRIGSYDLMRYASSWQWRYELDVLAADVVTYRVFRLSQDPYALETIETLPLCRYPQLRADCAALVETFAAYIRSRGLEAFVEDRPEFETRPVEGPAFEDSPTKLTRARGDHHVALPGEVLTPGTRRYWATGAEWAEHANELGDRRGTRGKVYLDQAAHLAALSCAFIARQARACLEAIRASLLRPQNQYVPPRGRRGGTDYERVIGAVNNALQLPSDECAVATLPVPTFTLRRPDGARPQQASLF